MKLSNNLIEEISKIAEKNKVDVDSNTSLSIIGINKNNKFEIKINGTIKKDGTTLDEIIKTLKQTWNKIIIDK